MLPRITASMALSAFMLCTNIPRAVADMCSPCFNTYQLTVHGPDTQLFTCTIDRFTVRATYLRTKKRRMLLEVEVREGDTVETTRVSLPKHHDYLVTFGEGSIQLSYWGGNDVEVHQFCRPPGSKPSRPDDR